MEETEEQTVITLAAKERQCVPCNKVNLFGLLLSFLESVQACTCSQMRSVLTLAEVGISPRMVSIHQHYSKHFYSRHRHG